MFIGNAGKFHMGSGCGFACMRDVDDVLRARLKTLGVVEHHFALDRGAEKGVDWRICEFGAEFLDPFLSVGTVLDDVGGARGQRHVWAPFFSDGEFAFRLG
jgi:hypothetical protein